MKKPKVRLAESRTSTHMLAQAALKGSAPVRTPQVPPGSGHRKQPSRGTGVNDFYSLFSVGF